MQNMMKWSTVPAVVVLLAAFAAGAAAQSANSAIGDTQAEALREHIDEAEDVLDSLLEWRHVLNTATAEPRETRPPTEPATTLISVPRSEVSRMTKLIDAVVAMVPAPTGAAAPRGDLRAHAMKAQEIARELMPAVASQPVGTSGRQAGADLVTVDRAALERLEVEIDAMEDVAPRRLPNQ